MARLAGGAAALTLAGCDKLSRSDWFTGLLGKAEDVNRAVQPLVSGPEALAQEFTEADISPHFKANGTINPEDDGYRRMAANNFADWRLEIGGMVENPMRLGLADIRELPSRTQITRHDCVEGWSCIGKWKGVPLRAILERAKPLDSARYVMFFCADPMDKNPDGSVVK